MAQGVAVVVLLALAGTGLAGERRMATWGKPLEGEVGYEVNVDADGTTRSINISNDGERMVLEVLVLRPGATKPKRCRIPGIPKDMGLVGPASGVSHLASNPAGAMALTWNATREEGPDQAWMASAAPGGCFTKAKPMTRGFSFFNAVRVGDGGTVVAVWTESVGDGTRVAGYATGRAGRSLGKARRFTPRGPSPEAAGVMPALIGEDRVLWSWETREAGSVTRRWAATSAPRAGKIGRPLQVHVATGGEPSLPWPRIFTDARGGQLAFTDTPDHEPDQRLFIWTRRPGRPFGAPRSIPLPATHEATGAMNDAGDGVVAVRSGGDIYAIARRRTGRFSKLRRVTVADDPQVADAMETAIDGAGRAVVVWQSRNPVEGSATRIYAAAASPSAQFGPPVALSGSDRQIFEFPFVAANARGRVSLTWKSREYRSRFKPKAYLVRGKLTG